jgi:hypothetical protein
VLRLVDVPLVEIGPGQVRVAVRAVGVNPRDVRLLSGRFASEPLVHPAGLGRELSGVVDAVGDGVDAWRIGRAVFGRGPAGFRPERDTGRMCRSIKTLRPPVLPDEATEEEVRAAALQYVRKVSGFRAPAAHNREVFERAVDVIAEATAELLAGLEVRGAPRVDR